MKDYILPIIAILIGIGYYYFQPSVVIESSEEKRIDDKPLAKKNLESKDSENKPIGAVNSSEETRTEDKPLDKNNLENQESEDKPIGVIERPEEKRIDDKPIAKNNLESKNSEDKEIYGDPFPRRYLRKNWSTSEGPMKLVQGEDMWVRGFYYFDNNEVRGRVTTRYVQKGSRKILSGYWVQDKSDQRCDYPRFGSDYWGRLTFDFQGDQFTGPWSYCDDKPKPHYQWNGRLN